MGPAGPAQSTILFNQGGQTFSIPLHPAHLSQLSQATQANAMYSSDGAQYFQPVTQLNAQATGPKSSRTDRLEVCFLHCLGPLDVFFFTPVLSFMSSYSCSFERVSGKWVMSISI